MKKNKVLALGMSAVLLTAAAVGGTLAYFTDTDEATNTFTTTNVQIELIEQQRDYNEDGTLNGLEAFENGKVLMPIVGSAQGEKDGYGLPIAANYVDKIVTIKNLKADAYVRLYYAIPTVLDSVDDASKNIIHVNAGNKFVAAGEKTDGQAVNEDFKTNMSDETLLTEAYEINGLDYNIYYRDYNKVLTEDEETGSAFIVGLYMDAKVDYDGTQDIYTINGTNIDYDFTEGVNIPVYAVGVQAAGFETCDVAVDAAFGDSFNPWSASAN